MKEILAALEAFGTPAAADELLGPAVAAGLVVDDHTQVVFRHPLVRSGIAARDVEPTSCRSCGACRRTA
jgi:hypothetical protein